MAANLVMENLAQIPLIHGLTTLRADVEVLRLVSGIPADSVAFNGARF